MFKAHASPLLSAVVLMTSKNSLEMKSSVMVGEPAYLLPQRTELG